MNHSSYTGKSNNIGQKKRVASKVNQTPKPEPSKDKKKIIVIALFLILVGILSSIDFDYLFYDMFEIYKIESLEIVEDYTFDIKDTNGEFDINPFPTELEPGAPVTIDQKNEQLVYDGYEHIGTFVVGPDIEPGVYTVEVSGEINVDIDSDVHIPYVQNHFGDSKILYNIPLIPGDIVETEMDDLGLESSVKFIPQTSYTNYEPGLSGVFVYGLSNFNSQVSFEAESYQELEYYYPDEYGLDTAFLYDEDVTLNGNPGSYFTVDMEV